MSRRQPAYRPVGMEHRNKKKFWWVVSVAVFTELAIVSVLMGWVG